MIVFLDTEYTDSLALDLISLGMIGECDSCELYIERSDYIASWCNSFVQAAVLPQLGRAGPSLNRRQLAHQLALWFAGQSKELMIACESYVDWELLLDALGEHRPVNLVGRYDLSSAMSTTVFHTAVASYHRQNGPWHHALEDARALRHGWIAWRNATKLA